MQLYTLGRSPIVVDKVTIALADYPDKEAAFKLLHGLEYGFKLNYSGPRIPFIMHTRAILRGKAVIAEQKILKEISLGRIAGPFVAPPFPTLRTSPISVVPNKSGSEFRLIHNLSFPHDQSVNDFIDREYCSVKYSSIDDAVKIIHNLGRGSLLAKCDVKSAFRLLRFRDSAGGEQLGFGIYFGGKWAQSAWPTAWRESDVLSDITFLELFPVVIAVNIWGDLLRNKNILFHIDNKAVVCIINKKSSTSQKVMILVRKLVLACLKFNFYLKAEHIPGSQNCIADALSRFKFQKFMDLCPTADTQPSPIPAHLWTL